MTRKKFYFTDGITGKTYETPEFNGDKNEFIHFMCRQGCDATWEEIEKEFECITTLDEFIAASERAQRHYKPFKFYNEIERMVVELGIEILPIAEVQEVKIYFFTMKVHSSRQANFGKEIATKAGFIRATSLEEAEIRIWEKYGSDSSCGLNVWEAEDQSTECFTMYYK